MPILGYQFSFIIGPIRLRFKPKGFLDKLALFQHNINSNWFKMTSIKTLTNRSRIRYIYKAFSILYALLTYCLIFRHFIRTSNTSSFLSHDIQSSEIISNLFGMILEPIAQSSISYALINPSTQHPIFGTIIFWCNIRFYCSIVSLSMIQVYDQSISYVIYLKNIFNLINSSINFIIKFWDSVYKERKQKKKK